MKRARKTQEAGPSALASIVPGLNRFSQKLFEYLCLEKENNLVISPLGISMLLAMVADGAQRQSLAELQSILSLPTKNTGNAGYKALIDYLNLFETSDCEMHVVNKIVTADTLKIKKKFKDDMNKYFSSEILAMDWTKVDEICEAANTFCKEKTNGRISSILTPPDVPKLPSLILLNAVYLKCPWAERFDDYDTKPKPFHVSNRLKVEIPMMHKTSSYYHGRIPEVNARFIVLPLKDDRMKMMIFLPNELIGIKDLEQHLSSVSFTKLQKSFESDYIGLSLPKFRVENSIDVTTTLKEMRLKEVCNSNLADFTGVSSTLPLFIDGVIQKTFLDVNEMGIEAAAVTRLLLTGGGSGPLKILKFTVNRPFMCAIIAEDYGIPIFMATIENPTL